MQLLYDLAQEFGPQLARLGSNAAIELNASGILPSHWDAGGPGNHGYPDEVVSFFCKLLEKHPEGDGPEYSTAAVDAFEDDPEGAYEAWAKLAGPNGFIARVPGGVADIK